MRINSLVHYSNMGMRLTSIIQFPGERTDVRIFRSRKALSRRGLNYDVSLIHLQRRFRAVAVFFEILEPREINDTLLDSLRYTQAANCRESENVIRENAIISRLPR